MVPLRPLLQTAKRHGSIASKSAIDLHGCRFRHLSYPASACLESAGEVSPHRPPAPRELHDHGRLHPAAEVLLPGKHGALGEFYVEALATVRSGPVRSGEGQSGSASTATAYPPNNSHALVFFRTSCLWESIDRSLTTAKRTEFGSVERESPSDSEDKTDTSSRQKQNLLPSQGVAHNSFEACTRFRFGCAPRDRLHCNAAHLVRQLMPRHDAKGRVVDPAPAAVPRLDLAGGCRHFSQRLCLRGT